MGGEMTFDKVQNSIINSSALEPFRCLVIDSKESEISDFLNLKIILNREINEEFLLRKNLLINIETVSKEKYLIKDIKEENEIVEKDDKSRKFRKENLINCFIIIEKFQGIIKDNNLYCEILKFKVKEKNFNCINIKEYKHFHFMHSFYIDLISFIYNKKEKTLFSIYLKSLDNFKSNKNNEYQDLNEKKFY